MSVEEGKDWWDSMQYRDWLSGYYNLSANPVFNSNYADYTQAGKSQTTSKIYGDYLELERKHVEELQERLRKQGAELLEVEIDVTENQEALDLESGEYAEVIKQAKEAFERSIRGIDEELNSGENNKMKDIPEVGFYVCENQEEGAGATIVANTLSGLVAELLERDGVHSIEVTRTSFGTTTIEVEVEEDNQYRWVSYDVVNYRQVGVAGQDLDISKPHKVLVEYQVKGEDGYNYLVFESVFRALAYFWGNRVEFTEANVTPRVLSEVIVFSSESLSGQIKYIQEVLDDE